MPSIKAYVNRGRLDEIKDAMEIDGPQAGMAELINLDIQIRTLVDNPVYKLPDDDAVYVEDESSSLALSLTVSLPATHQLPPAPEDGLLSQLRADIADTTLVERQNNDSQE